MTQPEIPRRTLGRYELLMPLAKGGMAQVWAARLRGTRGFQKIVAIKTILLDTMDGARAEQMFLEEATLASQIHHPNVVGTLELGEQDGTLYLVMEWVNGESLSDILLKAKDSRIPLPIAANLISQACNGLHAAHEARDEAGELLGIVHRDVSPQNVLVSYQGTAKLVDFGIAKATSRASELTHQGELKGKFAYMAPEQIGGAVLDRRADVFGMGVLLYALTTGKHPFRGLSAGETLRNICVTAPTPPSALVDGYPSVLEQVVLRALAKLPGDRFATAHDLLVAIEDAVPESLSVREPEVAAYLKELFGSRGSERINQIRVTQQLVDAGGPGSSVSSLRAVAIDQTAAPSEAPSLEVSYTAASPMPELVAPTRRSRKAAPLLLGAVLLLGAAALAWSRVGTTSPATASASHAVAELEPHAPSAAASLLSPTPVPSPSVTAPLVEPRASDGPEPRGATKAASRKAALTTPKPVAPPPVDKHAAQPAPVIAAPTPRPAEVPSPRKPNAWDADNYGGRR